MQNRSHALAAGVFVLLLTVAVIAVAVWLAGYHVSRVPYLMVSHEPATGLSSQSAVFYRGVPVGVVESIRLDPQNFHDILVRVDIDRDVPITRGTSGALQSEGIMGTSAIELDDSRKDPARLPTSEQAPGRIPLGPSFLDTLTRSGGTLIKRLSKLAADLDGFASPTNRADTSRVLTETQVAMAQMIPIEKRLNSALATLPALSRDSRHTLSHIDALSDSLQKLSGSLDTLSVRAGRFVGTGTAVGEDLRDTTLPQFDRLLRQLSAETQQLQQLTTSLKQDPQMLLYGSPDPTPGPGEPGYARGHRAH